MVLRLRWFASVGRCFGPKDVVSSERLCTVGRLHHRPIGLIHRADASTRRTNTVPDRPPRHRYNCLATRTLTYMAIVVFVSLSSLE